MTDKERILLWLLHRIYCSALYSPNKLREWRDMQPGLITDRNPIAPGDLVTGLTTMTPNEFLVGYVHEVKPHCVVIREIGSNRLCEYGNESFLRIDKDLLGYEILEGIEYQTYQKVLKAFSKAKSHYSIRFCSIAFDGNLCKVEGRKVFSDEIVISFSFAHNAKTTISSIVELIEKQVENV